MSRESMMKKHGLSAEDFQPKKPETNTVEISREDFDLLDAEEDGVIYYIHEEDNTVTIKIGVNE